MRKNEICVGPNKIANMWVGSSCFLNVREGEKSVNKPAKIVGKFDEFATIIGAGKKIRQRWDVVEQVMLGAGTFYA
jgi:hypothetical protein